MAESLGGEDFLLQKEHEAQDLAGPAEQEREHGRGLGDPDGDPRPQESLQGGV